MNHSPLRPEAFPASVPSVSVSTALAMNPAFDLVEHKAKVLANVERLQTPGGDKAFLDADPNVIISQARVTWIKCRERGQRYSEAMAQLDPSHPDRRLFQLVKALQRLRDYTYPLPPTDKVLQVLVDHLPSLGQASSGSDPTKAEFTEGKSDQAVADRYLVEYAKSRAIDGLVWYACECPSLRFSSLAPPDQQSDDYGQGRLVELYELYPDIPIEHVVLEGFGSTARYLLPLFSPTQAKACLAAYLTPRSMYNLIYRREIEDVARLMNDFRIPLKHGLPQYGFLRMAMEVEYRRTIPRMGRLFSPTRHSKREKKQLMSPTRDRQNYVDAYRVSGACIAAGALLLPDEVLMLPPDHALRPLHFPTNFLKALVFYDRCLPTLQYAVARGFRFAPEDLQTLVLKVELPWEILALYLDQRPELPVHHHLRPDQFNRLRHKAGTNDEHQRIVTRLEQRKGSRNQWAADQSDDEESSADEKSDADDTMSE